MITTKKNHISRNVHVDEIICYLFLDNIVFGANVSAGSIACTLVCNLYFQVA